MNTSNRLGLTLLEMVTVVLICLVLLALLLPAVRTARGPARRTQCLDNQRNVTVAILNFASTNDGRFPAQAHYLDRIRDDDNASVIFDGRSWVVDLLPYMDGQGTYDRWDKTQPWNSRSSDRSGVSNAELSRLKLDFLGCPEDPSSFFVDGGLSYALNCGVGDRNWIASVGPKPECQLESGHHFMVEPFDWNGNGILPPEDLEDAAITRDFGVFWPQFGSPSDGGKDDLRYKHHVVGEIYDGSGNTIMLGENINAGTRPGNNTPSWADPHIGSSGLVLPVDAKQINKTIHSNDGSLADVVISKPFSPAINQSKNAGEGKAPFANTNHPGIGVFAYCDGSVLTISENIDLRVYTCLMTPCGTRERDLSGFVSEQPVTADDF
ncbi:DUF1559 domain-containing protein [Fuerstiella marisgermanici]|uniref:DUF1559 domain-containing protein n=1 Tax=Fuerstiella marisgermanici TaxID=1891926 RepID=A0A1P8WKT0_9PLAN|nr:DUF1559 domain-containing protein [Fuerstiella marisgermanici]APZ94655.1 hypothetical protein Fuma_04288 [Fuerstiella marisgermanici]